MKMKNLLLLIVVLTMSFIGFSQQASLIPEPEIVIIWSDMFQMLFICLLGGIAHLIMKLIEESKRTDVKFYFDQYLKLYWKAALLNMILAFIIVYVGTIDKSILVVTPFTALLAGYSGSSLFTNIIQTGKKK